MLDDINVNLEELVESARQLLTRYSNALGSISSSATTASLELIALKESLRADLEMLGGFDYINAHDPEKNTNPLKQNAIWFNTSSLEIFVCRDNQTDNNTWAGNQYSSIGTGHYANAGEIGFGVGVAPQYLVDAFGLTPMEGCTSKAHPNYGNYTDNSGSIMCYIPKIYIKKTNVLGAPYFGNRVDASFTQDEGYALPRCFVNNGIEIDGIFVDKYDMGKEGTVGVSKRYLRPVSTASVNNPISALTANSQTCANTYLGTYNAVKTRGDDYSQFLIFTATLLADIADAHYQACYRKGDFSICAWGEVAPYGPKGCNNNALADVNDSTVIYTSSGYDKQGLTGGVSDSVFAKTTHNGQKCGVADVNGNMWNVVAGYITGTTGIHYTLKESVDVRTLTSANAYDIDNYEVVAIPVTLNNTQVAFGNGENRVFDGSVDRTSNAYKIDQIGLPVNDSAVSASGTVRMGDDGFWRYQVNSCASIVGGGWDGSALAGVRARNLGYPSSGSRGNVGCRACLVPWTASGSEA